MGEPATLAELIAALLIAVLLSACGGTPVRGEADVETRRFSGRITYDARQPTQQGTSEATEVRPARHVEVAVIGANGEVVSEGSADEDGVYTLEGPSDARAVRVSARVRVRGHDIAVARDARGRETHTVDVPIEDPEAVSLHAQDQTGDGGAFHVVDTLLRGLDAATSWSGQTLPPVFVYWIRGGTREWSFYRGEQPAGSGRYALELLGGDPGQASISDTDEHDEAIILHELGHFVMDRLSGDSSTGGMHPTGARIDPGLAWEEGRATWFALAVLGEPLYQDTIGVQPWGSLRVDAELESVPDEDDVVGLGSETTVSRVLWDLSDGGNSGLPDQDGDPVALGPAPVLRAMITQFQQSGSYASLPSFLLHLVSEETVPRDTLAAMLTATGESPDALLPATLDEAWPRAVTPGMTLTGRIDGMTQPAPGGGMNLPQNGFAAIHTYRVHVEQTGMLMLRLSIQGTGRGADHQDLDLELLDLRADRLADSRGETPQEAVGHLVQPGWYIARVRDGGRGNAADYRLEVLLETL